MAQNVSKLAVVKAPILNISSYACPCKMASSVHTYELEPGHSTVWVVRAVGPEFGAPCCVAQAAGYFPQQLAGAGMLVL